MIRDANIVKRWAGRVVALALAILCALAPAVAKSPASGASTSAAPPPTGLLPALGADLRQTSVSGISSGAYMAGQFQIAHGDLVVGAGIVAGGPYGCAESVAGAFMIGFARINANASQAALGCMLATMGHLGVPNVGLLVRRTKRLAERGAIPALATIRSDRVLLFTGLRDTIVSPEIVRAAARFYRELGIPEQNLLLLDTFEAGHGFVSNRAENKCRRSGTPYLINCEYDLAGAILTHIYGTLAPAGDIAGGDFMTFDQTAYVDPLARHGLDSTAKAFVPAACRSANGRGCRVHVAFHGCNQGRELIGDRFVGRSGFARWAVSNRIIVLFPQVRRSALNPQGCWDWWGYTGRRFLTREAPQIAAVRAMLARLAE